MAKLAQPTSRLQASPPPGPAWIGRVTGALVLALALIGLVWVGRIAIANYRYAGVRALADKAETPAQLNASEQQLKGLLAWDPSNSEVRNRYASLLARKHDYRAAIQQLERARQTGNAQSGLFLVADMYEKLGDLDRAEQLMANALLLNVNNAVFRDAYLRLLNNRYLSFKAKQAQNQPFDPADLEAVRRQFAHEARSWAVRAPHDANSYMFLAQFYIEPLFALQAYRCYLLGLSGAPSMSLNPELMISPSSAMGTIRQIFNGFAKPYRNLP